MTKTKTVLVAFAALALAGNAYSQLRPKGLPRRSTAEAPSSAAKEEGQSGTPGVTAPFIPFERKDKIKYEEAVERAKTNDAEAFYWLAYYFLKGEGVEINREAAGTFLQKAVDARHAKACYLAGLYHEFYSLVDEHNRSVSSFNGLLPQNEFLEIQSTLQIAGIYYGSALLQMPKREELNHFQTHHPRLFRRPNTNMNCCYTNEVATGFVIGLYSTAVKGGLSYAITDIDRLERTIAKCRERIGTREQARIKSAAALDLLVDANAKKSEFAKQKEGEKRRRESEYWATWPTTLSDEEMTRLDSDFEKRFNCVFLEKQYSRPLRINEKRSDSKHSRTNTWVQGCGKSLIVFHGANYEFFQKIDTNGLIVAWGLSKNRTDLEELKWYEEEKEKRLVPLRSKWAKERGMSLEDAMQKYKTWHEQNRLIIPPQPNRLLNRPIHNVPSPKYRTDKLSEVEMARARRQVRLATEVREAEKKHQEAIDQMRKEREELEREREERERELKRAAEERKAQMDQLLQLRDELRRQREERVHENGRP